MLYLTLTIYARLLSCHSSFFLLVGDFLLLLYSSLKIIAHNLNLLHSQLYLLYHSSSSLSSFLSLLFSGGVSLISFFFTLIYTILILHSRSVLLYYYTLLLTNPYRNIITHAPGAHTGNTSKTLTSVSLPTFLHQKKRGII